MKEKTPGFDFKTLAQWSTTSRKKQTETLRHPISAIRDER